MNPYLWSKYWYEIEGDRRSALEEFNLYLEREIGKKGFHSFDKKLFINAAPNSKYSTFQSAIQRLMCYPSLMGSSDFLSALYGEVFEAIWKVFPSNELLISLFIKDFNKPSLQQLYINPVPEDEYGDNESPHIITKVLAKSAKEGLFYPDTSSHIPFGVPVMDMENVSLIGSGQWRGLKEWFLTELPKIEVEEELRNTRGLWQKMLVNDSLRVVETGINYLFGNFFADRAKLVLKGKSIFHTQGFKDIFQKALLNTLESDKSIIEAIPYYAGYGALSYPEIWVEGLVQGLNSPVELEKFFDNWKRA